MDTTIVQFFRRSLGVISTDLNGVIAPWHLSPLIVSHRAELIIARVRLIALLFALLTPLWCIVDLLLVPESALARICIARLLAASAFVAVVISYRRANRSLHAYLALGALFLIPTFFYVFTTQLLATAELGNVSLGYLRGYTLLPLVIAAGLTVFPLSAVEGMVFALPVIAVQWVMMRLFGGSGVMEQSGLLWLLVQIAAVAVIAGMIQLHYLSEVVTKSAHDPLTNTHNRLAGEEFMEKYFSLARRNGTPFSLIVLDIDRLKAINDDYGYQRGDAVLRQLSAGLLQQLRKEDFLIRWGGEVFVIALSGTGLAGARELVLRIGREGLGLRPDGTALTASLGIACTQDDSVDELAGLLRLADERMQQAKGAGRNLYCDGVEGDGARVAPFIKIGA